MVIAKMKLSTLEKSRLDWASFVDKRNINEELKIHNKAGYLDKQDFINRMNSKRDDLYLQAKEKEKYENNNYYRSEPYDKDSFCFGSLYIDCIV